MKYCLITFRSVTPAQRAERELRKAGYFCVIQRTPKWMENQGCGYSLRVLHKGVKACVLTLQNAQVAYRKVYCLQENGGTEELEI